MPENETIEQQRVASPVAPAYTQSIRESAKNLPPVEGFVKKTTSPTDKEVLGKNTTEHTLEQEEDFEEEEVEEIPEPVIDPIKTEVNEEAEAAKEEVAGEKKVDEFKLDDENDTEFLKDLYKNEISAEGKEEVKTPKASEIEIEAKYAPYKAKAAEYDAVLADPLIKAFIENVKAGKKNPIEFAKSVGFIDVESMTAEEVIKYECEQAKLTPEETEMELESFSSMTALQKKRHVESTKSELIQKRDEKLKTFTAGNEKVQAVQREAAKVGTSQLKDLSQKMVGKKYEGLLITPEMMNSIEQHVISRPEPVFDEKGQFVGYDIKESISTAVTKLYKDQWKKALVELGRTIGADKTLTARIRPNKKIAGAAAIPIQQKDFKDIVNDASKKTWDKRLGNKPNTKI